MSDNIGARPSDFDPSRWAWRTDRPSFDETPIYQFILVEGYQEHSGQLWQRRWAGTAGIDRGGPFGYRQSDIDRLMRDGDMVVIERVLGWMPAMWPRWDFDAIAAGSGTAETSEDLAQCEASQSGAESASPSISSQGS